MECINNCCYTHFLTLRSKFEYIQTAWPIVALNTGLGFNAWEELIHLCVLCRKAWRGKLLVDLYYSEHRTIYMIMSLHMGTVTNDDDEDQRAEGN